MGYVCLFVGICSGSGFIHYSVCTDYGCRMCTYRMCSICIVRAICLYL